MSETKHTPGPWGVQRYRNYVGFSVWAGDRGCIAERWYDTEQNPPYGDEIVANARLISAAPELLAFARRYLDSDATTAECDALAKAAIAKATGGAA
jgi:hypothetical protein